MMKRRILLAEDDPDIMTVTRLRLIHEGYDVETAGDGEAVLDRVGVQAFDLVLLDIKMPRLNGYEVCRRLKAATDTAAIPIIIFTASEVHWSRLADQCIEAGATDWIKKPFRTKDLMQKVHRALGEEGPLNG